MTIPNHIAIIPDGNRRWAKARLLNPWDGHTEGVKRYWESAEYILSLGVKNLTFWAGSYDNLLKRSKIEVKFLMKLFVEEISNPELLNKFLKNKTRLRVIGEWQEFIEDKSLIASVKKLESATEHFKEYSLTILFAYDGKREMLATANSLVKSGKKVTDTNLRASLWTGDLPDVDLVIRTGGEPHWSAGFMMWLTANSQFYFTDLLWPDFKEKEIKKALAEYERRERRLGK